MWFHLMGKIPMPGKRAWFKIIDTAGDKSRVAGVELAIASEPPVRRPQIWGRRPPGVYPRNAAL